MGAPVFPNILSSNANIAVHFHFSTSRNAILDQSHFIRSLNCVLPKSSRQLHSGGGRIPARPATVSAQLAQIGGRPRLKLTIVPSTKTELFYGLDVQPSICPRTALTT